MQFDESFWDERYRQHGSVWSRNPNPTLMAEAAALRPGSALDVGSGEGADSIWLARQGWRVTAVDISSVALARAAERAAEDAALAGRIVWVHHDLTASPPPAGTFDLVSAQFMHLPQDPRTELYHRLAASVAPGGTLLIVGHHPADLAAGIPRPSQPGLLFTPEEIAAELDPDEWEIDVCEARRRSVTDSEGGSVTVTDSVLRAHRRAPRP
ncbi:class I SAM-dependent methyltransferase [Arthrobacter sp. 24S4-2]|uniref:class I SAM-dependent methyltransferase n=1 Tax=Arthrobacter sp. 24S4-2 TaxID=2575374 RepID=UPI0010C78416|nr:class I SAM-dependent methyltransferase [Arthrobacter sp. 24S4-2]QCO96821.1 class I SAM-dependent methyltransferase [Arthrobacter sp. 24S4-2]